MPSGASGRMLFRPRNSWAGVDMKISSQAKELNGILKKQAPQVYSMLSGAGKKAFFPKSGILAQTAEAKGKRINATIGVALEDGGAPLALDVLMKNSKLEAHETVSYSPSHGQQRLREAWLQRIRQNNPSLRTKTTLPVCTAGLTSGLSILGRLFLDDNENIILPEPFWGNYKLVFQHAELDTFPCFDGHGFNVSGLEKKLHGPGKKHVLLLNFPNNPTGYSITEQEASEIVKAIKKSAEAGKRILVICDDAYFGLFFEPGLMRESIFSKLAGLHENILAVKVDGITKELYAWGLRIGFVTYGFRGMDDDTAQVLEDKTSGSVRGSISNTCTHSQFLAVRALESLELKKQEKDNLETIRVRYEEIKRILSDSKYAECLEPLPFNSGYFICVRLKDKTPEQCEQVRKTLLSKYDTGIISMGNLFRIAFSSVKKELLRELFENLYSACKV